MFTRLLEKPERSVLLLGPRGTGKSTWIQQHFENATQYDLLNTSEALRLSRDPSLLFEELHTKKEGEWVVLDEVQKVPALLNEVHRLMEQKKLKFVLCGSSARKLQQDSVNLLAGRARTMHLYPFVSAEVGFDFEERDVLAHGMLPLAFTHAEPKEYLRSYVETYLAEEIRAEGLARNLGSFGRFLEIAARQNGQLTNSASIARDAQVPRPTVQGYFDVLEDTLMGSMLRPWKLKSSNKQVSRSKFFFFDMGVARALSGRLPYAPSQEEYGPLVETCIHHELRAYMTYRKLHYPLYFWRNYNGTEVDFLFENEKGYVAIEVKASSRWERKFNRGFKHLKREFEKPLTCLGVFLGPRPLMSDDVEVLPLKGFLKRLWADAWK